MTIADRKEVSSPVLAQMRQDEVRVLVDFVRVLGAEASLRGEGELGHTVVKLLCCLWLTGRLCNRL